MIKLKAILLSLFLIIVSVNTAFAVNVSEIIVRHEDFSSSVSGFSKVSAPDAMYITYDLLDDTNKVFVFEGGNDRAADMAFTANENDSLIFEGKMLRKYGTNANPFWDLRFFLTGSEDSTMLTSVGQAIYVGNDWQYLCDYYMQPMKWIPFLIIISKSGSSIESELFLDGTGYGKVSSQIAGDITGIQLYSMNSAENGNIYFDDICVIRETPELSEILDKVQQDSATKDECSMWLKSLSKYYDIDGIKKYYKIINDYADSKGYIDEFAVSEAYPAEGEKIYAGNDLVYVFNNLLYNSVAVTIKSDDEIIQSKVQIIGNKLSITADFMPESDYLLEISGIRCVDGREYDFKPVSFKTNIIPKLNIKAGRHYEMGDTINWTDIDGVTTTARLEADGKTAEIKNGCMFTLSGDVTVQLVSERGDMRCEEGIAVNVIHNDPPQAKDIKITGVVINGETIKGEYTYCDNDGDGQDKEKTKCEWYATNKADGDYKKFADGEEITIDKSLFNMYLKFSVTPASVKEPKIGNITWSEVIVMPFAPVVSNVKIEGNTSEGSILSGYYDYFDANGDAENLNSSLLEWIDSDEKVIATGTTLELSSGMAGSSIALRVTAKNNAEPMESKPAVSSYINVGKRSGGSGGSGYVGSNSGSNKKTQTPQVSVPTVQQKPQPTADSSFSDINGHWAKNYIETLKNKKLINGVTETLFKPDDTISRCQMLALIVRAFGVQETEYKGGFTDVKVADWYSGYVQAALENEIISKSDMFYPEMPVKREETAKLVNIFVKESTSGKTFTDSAEISQWAKKYVDEASSAGLFEGDAEGNFRPHDDMTRAEAAVIICRITDLGKAVVK